MIILVLKDWAMCHTNNNKLLLYACFHKIFNVFLKQKSGDLRLIEMYGLVSLLLYVLCVYAW